MMSGQEFCCRFIIIMWLDVGATNHDNATVAQPQSKTVRQRETWPVILPPWFLELGLDRSSPEAASLGAIKLTPPSSGMPPTRRPEMSRKVRPAKEASNDGMITTCDG
jgi:hypothetical protein